MSASVGVLPPLSQGGAARLRAGLVVESRVPAETEPPPSQVSFPDMFGLRCAEVHPVGCDVRLRAASLESLMILACKHGALAHGFTPCWYSSRRLASMAEIVTQCCG